MIRLLSSPVDGEVLGAARGIMRVLKGAGTDIHELARIVENPATVHVDKKKYPNNVDDDNWSWRDIVEFCASHADSLKERESEFVTDMVGNLREWGKPTEKQGKWLKDIFRVLRRRFK